MPRLIWGLMGFVACAGPEDEKPVGGDDDDGQVTSLPVDRDGDGYSAEEDCDDALPEVHPSADEHCDGVDEDCDAVVDDDPVDGAFGYTDADADGYGVELVDPCDPGAYASLPGDCDDDDPEVNPGAGERCNGLDDDCSSFSPDTAQIGDRGFDSIGDALAAAVDGDVVEVCDGWHYEWGLVVERAVTVTSHSGDRDAAVLHGDGAGSVFVVDGGSLTLRSVTVRDGFDAAAYGAGGAVRADAGAVVVEDCVITENEVTAGSGGAISGSEVTVTDSLFTENRAATEGGAIWIAPEGTLEVTGSTFTANEVTLGSGGVISGSEVTVTDSLFTDNRAGTDGGAIWIAPDGTLEVTGSTFEDNEAEWSGGAIQVRNAVVATIDGCTFTGNHAELGGGAVAAVDLTVLDSVFEGNTGQSGGAISMGGTCTVVGSRFEGNDAGVTGGALVAGGEVSLSDTSLVDNTALVGGAMYMSYTTSPETSHLELVGVSFDRNRARVNAGALYLLSASGTADAGTAFTDNVATDGYLGNGGALYANMDPEDTWSGGTFRGNFGDEQGGAVYALAGTFTGMTIEGNTSRYGGGMYLLGSGIAVRDSIISGNSASGGGGGVRASPLSSTDDPIVLERVELRGNTSLTSAAGVAIDDADVQLLECVVEENAAATVGGGVGFTGTEGSLVVESSDFGVDLTDNTPEDVWDGGGPHQGYGAGATFSCVFGSCTSP